MTELSFLLDLLLEHKLPKAAKDAVRARIKFVEGCVRIDQPRPVIAPAMAANPIVAQQAPSMQALMAKHPDLIPAAAEPAPVAVIAQTPAAAAALASRQEAIAAAQAGKTNASGGKRKF